MLKGLLGGAAVLFSLLLLVALLSAGVQDASATPLRGGCTVTISPAGQAGGQATAPGEQVEATLSADQMAVARTVVAVGKGLGVTRRGTAIALATAMQESTLDPNAVSGRSLGLFQQQGELYAGVNRTDPADTARAFYEQLLTRIPNYDDPAVALADAAQTVQASGAGASWYARWDRWATALAAQLHDGTLARGGADGAGGIVCAPGGGSGPIRVLVSGTTITLPPEAGILGTLTMPNERVTTVVAAALSYLGTRYSWGGGNAVGPTVGIRDGGVADAHGDYATVGFDCSGLMVYAFAQIGVTLPRVSQDQQRFGHPLPWEQAQPGDMLFWGRPATHVALYLGALQGVHYMVEAPQSGDVVKVSMVRTRTGFDSQVVRAW
ncbi:C40 family peptidase [Saccharothrix longispora]|uniref:C40 family peptidase n=1 Tax=Saccharothrix longispora TaxID=33920 RepID=UPI0028FD6B3E|nr:NlpC/P60 family protein [Saccharothrix longispora]MDU0293315.1 NlpC/P60 family protein [Saccharothrix longispora]